MHEMLREFMEQYNVCIENGKPKVCTREECSKLIVMANKINSAYHIFSESVSFGNEHTGFMNIDELAKLYNLARFNTDWNEKNNTSQVELIKD